MAAETIEPRICVRCGETATHFTIDGIDSKLICHAYPKCFKLPLPVETIASFLGAYLDEAHDGFAWDELSDEEKRLQLATARRFLEKLNEAGYEIRKKE